MKTLPMNYFGEAEEQSSDVTVAMEVDDVDSSLDIFGEGPVLDLRRLATSDFFNSFQDNFDDGYFINLSIAYRKTGLILVNTKIL
ncbi:hypothetical protein PHJA_000100100 [Phtheirospermum japonicum]|uniref:Uncharacterized protein n=1 Tax=Phtheirospermum japonicum TaxID=374723 RepID=A0A830AZB8_9LAMI|nr:hypothetical protein PHJA_000100100 [Phtheirospermum japonicum]